MILEYKIIQGIFSYVTQNPDVTYDECVNLAVNYYNFTEDRAKFWIDLFLNAICNNLGVETSVSEAKNWINNQVNNNVTIDQLCDKLIAIVAAVWDEDEEIVVTRNNQLYRKIQKYNIDLSQPPTGIHSVHFANISINTVNGGREAIITVGRWSYSLPWDKLPDRFKQLYVAWLRLQNANIPDDLQQYVTDNIDISNLYFDINLDEAVLLSEV